MTFPSLAEIRPSGIGIQARRLPRFLAALIFGVTVIFTTHAAPVFEPVAFFEKVSSDPSRGSLLLHTDGNFYGASYSGGAQDFGTIYRVTPAGDLRVVVHFNGTSGTAKGRTPNCRLVSDGTGFLWGTTQLGGTPNHGTIFKVNPTTGVFTTVVEFTGTVGAAKGSDPQAGLVSDGSGNFWGTTQLGGASDRGTVFRLNAATGVLTTFVEFTGVAGAAKGSNPQAALTSDGAGSFWGTTQQGGTPNAGTIFKVNATTGELTSVLDFPSSGSTPRAPLGSLVSDGAGNFWGTTPQGGASNLGTVYKVNMTTAELATVVQFTGTGGATPGRGPVAELATDGLGNFWGATSGGGATNVGTIFKVRISTGALTSVVAFTGNAGAVKGENPQAGLTRDSTNNFWGTTLNSGSLPAGTVFRVNIASGILTTVVQFPNGLTNSRGTEPTGTLFPDTSGTLWGTTRSGSGFGIGTIYHVNPGTGILTTFLEFPIGSNNNREPLGGVVSDGTGNFWGTTSNGGPSFNGSIFKVNATTAALSTPVLFTGTSGAALGTDPLTGLTHDGLGFLWGTTADGGTDNNGTVFKVNIATGALTTVADFTRNVGPFLGDRPASKLLNDGAGYMWGTTNQGGVTTNSGTIFKINTTTGAFTNVVQFTGTSGAVKGSSPSAGLASDGAGNLWGITSAGGTLGFGTVFKVNTMTGALTTVLEFTGASGAIRGSAPRSPLTLDGAGNFWGMTNAGGAAGLGTIYRVSLAGSFSSVFSFTGIGGAIPGQDPTSEGILYHTDGSLYGVVSDGGFGGGGLVFRIRLDPSPPTGGTLTLAPPSPVSPATAMTATAAGWTDANLPLSYEFSLDAVSLGARGAASSINFNAPAGSGQHTVTLRVFDALDAFAEVNESFVVDNPPVARVATLGAVAGGASSIAVSKLLKYATDADEDAFTIIAVSPNSAQGGTVVLSDGFITYTPPVGYSGPDSFTYTLRDERGATSTGTVNVTVASASAPSLNVVSLRRTAEGFLARFAGIPGAAYVIQFRDAMTAPWQTLSPPGSIVAGANGLFEFEDKPEPIPASRFYRAAEAP